MGDAVGGFNGELQSGSVGGAGAVEVGWVDSLLIGEPFDLFGRAVHDGEADVEGAQEREVEEDVGEVFVGDDASIHGEDEGLFPELRNVLENSAEIG